MLWLWIALGVVAVLVVLVVVGYNRLVRLRNEADTGWANIDVQLQRRADLIPNLVEVVKGYAAHERETLTDVVEARSKVSQMKIPEDILTNEEAFQRFQQNQNRLSGALSRLLVVVERYPDLKANQNFLALQSQIEGTENRISVARRDYIEAVRMYNTELRTFPGRIWAATLYSDAKPKQNFTVEDEKAISEPPKVKLTN